LNTNQTANKRKNTESKGRKKNIILQLSFLILSLKNIEGKIDSNPNAKDIINELKSVIKNIKERNADLKKILSFETMIFPFL
jgi:hypothetical protein